MIIGSVRNITSLPGAAELRLMGSSGVEKRLRRIPPSLQTVLQPKAFASVRNVIGDVSDVFKPSIYISLDRGSLKRVPSFPTCALRSLLLLKKGWLMVSFRILRAAETVAIDELEIARGVKVEAWKRRMYVVVFIDHRLGEGEFVTKPMT